jgi:hypothetical protein
MNRYEINTFASILNDALSREAEFGPRAPRARRKKSTIRRGRSRRQDR